MWTTGLVSLSIHEALAFGEGVEIALNPDLFNDAGPSRERLAVPRGLGNSSIASSTMKKPHHQRAGSDSILAVPSEESKTDDGKPPILNSASFSTANSAPNRRLEVGDMINIRVWDPLPNSAKNSPQALKRRSPPASKDTSRAGSGSNSVATEGQTHVRKTSYTSATLEAAITSLQQSKTASSSGSLQYSLDSSFPISVKEESAAKEKDTSTVSSNERPKDTIELLSEPPSPKEIVSNTVTAAPSDDNRAGMPPTFPRARADTADASPTRLLAPKPPPVQRSRTNMTAPVDTLEARRRTSSSFIPQSTTTAKPTGIHVRDISDMTMDTILGSSIPESGETIDDGDEDDTMSRISQTHTERFSFVMLVTEGTLTSLKETARTQVSMLRQGKDDAVASASA